ncbi:MAG: hypothetical protein ABIG70_12820 [Pseudomonadota bacterium]
MTDSKLDEGKEEALRMLEHDAGALLQREGIAHDMARAMLNITRTIREHPGARWKRCCPLTCENNLSWVVARELDPVMSRIQLHQIIPASSIPAYHQYLNMESRADDIYKLENLIRDFFCRGVDSGSGEEIALNHLLRSLLLLRSNFAPAPRTTRARGARPFCKYCFREIRTTHDGYDTCHVHSDKNSREAGENLFNRYKKISKFLKSIPDRKERHHFPITMTILKNQGLRDWSGRQDDIDWIQSILTLLDVCAPSRTRQVAELLSKASMENDRLLYEAAVRDSPSLSHEQFEHERVLSGERNPTALTGTLLSHEAFRLAEIRPPATLVAQKMARLWLGESPSEVAKAMNDSMPNLRQTRVRWENKIRQLRSQSIKDDVIKYVLGLDVLPPAKPN